MQGCDVVSNNVLNLTRSPQSRMSAQIDVVANESLKPSDVKQQAQSNKILW